LITDKMKEKKAKILAKNDCLCLAAE